MANFFLSTVAALLVWWTGFYAVEFLTTYELIVFMVDKNYKLKWHLKKKLNVVYDSENLSLFPKVYFKICSRKNTEEKMNYRPNKNKYAYLQYL